MTVLTNHLILIKYKVIKLKIKPKKHIKDKEDNRPKETEQRECTGAFSRRAKLPRVCRGRSSEKSARKGDFKQYKVFKISGETN